MKIYRHGDILITPVKAAPEYVSPQDDLIIARGEITGHAHRVVAEQHAELLTFENEMFLNITGGPATIVHEEHAPIELQPGMYRVWRQREYLSDSDWTFIED